MVDDAQNRASVDSSMKGGEERKPSGLEGGAAIEQAWRDFGDKLYGFVLSLVRNSADAEDVLQNVFLGYARRLSREGQVQNPRAYLYRVARNEAWRWVYERRKPLVHDEEVDPLLVEGEAEDRARAVDVSRALVALPAEQREVVVLKLWHDLTFEEVADIVGVSINTVASRYRYGLAKLRRSLALWEGSS